MSAHFHERLRAAIGTGHADITAIAHQCGWQPSHVSRLLNGKALPAYSSIVRLLAALPHVDARWLLLGNGGAP